MKKRIVSLLLLAVFAIGILAACGKSSALTPEQAQKAALEHLEISQKDVTDVHTHVVTENGNPCYSIHVSTADGEHTVLIHAGTGEVLSSADGAAH
jgi:uncharacterized membrane protein YkoI